MIEISLNNACDEDFLKLKGMSVKAIRTNGSNELLTDKALESLAFVEGLETLDLEWAINVTDEGILNLSNLKSLKYIDLSFCEKITNDGISALKSAIPQLKIER